MPEYAEIKITVDAINHWSENVVYDSVQKSYKHKLPMPNIYFDNFKIEASNHGKELALSFVYGDYRHYMTFRMGMTGHFQFVDIGKEPKHAHLIFSSTTSNKSLCFVDARRFGSWTDLGNDFYWDRKRGADIFTNLPSVVYDLKDAITHDKKFANKPIYEALLNQKYFNGVGNYLRAEILHEIDINPFQTVLEYFLKVTERGFIEKLQWLIYKAYRLGGGQLMDWKNPLGKDPQEFRDWIKVYKKDGMNSILDKAGRRFWYHPKWEKYKNVK